MKDLNTHEKLAEIIKALKQEAFGDAFSTKPYIVFVDEADQARNTMAGDKAAIYVFIVIIIIAPVYVIIITRMQMDTKLDNRERIGYRRYRLAI
ncbi:hypothetical protein C2G38_2172283 [Gigaspora rosea]|uniref:Uncharacterized protein n=1 Tax=Gigaspora rosea TaxID=44941 RepID=A0A397VVQ6_9GLOM|nr:hypothetical protein C2G38_2172283 [Gigaspora rosea]